MKILTTCALLLLVGCSMGVSTPLHMTSRAEFNPGERRAVWGRAVTSFQVAGALIELSDSVGGVLQSRAQPTWTQCNNGSEQAGGLTQREGKNLMCRSQIAVQFTMTDDGLAFLRVNRGVSGLSQGYDSAWAPKPLFTAEDLKALQNECDTWLQYIVGKSPKPPEPLRTPATQVLNT